MRSSKTALAMALGLVCLPGLAAGHPWEFETLSATLEDPASGATRELIVQSDGRYRIASRGAASSAPTSARLSEEGLRRLREAFRSAHLAGLPAVAPGTTLDRRTLTLVARSGWRTYGHVTAVGAELPRVRPLVTALLDLLERPSPAAAGRVEGAVIRRGQGVLLETERGAVPVRRLRSGGGTLAGYWDTLLQLLVGQSIAVVGRYDASGHWLDAEVFLARTTRSLEVRTSPDPSAPLNTFTGGPEGRLPSGTGVRVYGLARSDWVQIDLASGPRDAYAFVRFAGLGFDAPDAREATAVAERLGDLLGRRLEEAGVLQVPTFQGELERFRPLFTRAFGPALPQVSETEGKVVHGGRLVWSASMGGLEPRTTDGHPLLVVYGLWSASHGFFYQPTAIDTVTGEVWQGKSLAAAGAGPLTFFGPLLPPREARLSGFGLEELGGVDAILRQRVGARAP